MLDLSILAPVLGEIGDQGLDTFDLRNAQDGQRLRGSGRQFVRFYSKKESRPVTVEAKINPVTGASTPIKVEMREFVQDFINVINPGDKNEIDVPVEEHHKREFYRQYAAYKSGKGAPIGVPVEECSYIPPNVITDLRYNGCQTEEQLAEASDILCGIIPNGFQLRDFAKAVVKSKDANKASPQVQALQEQNREMQEKMNAMQEQLIALSTQQVEKRGPGRPPKILEQV